MFAELRGSAPSRSEAAPASTDPILTDPARLPWTDWRACHPVILDLGHSLRDTGDRVANRRGPLATSGLRAALDRFAGREFGARPHDVHQWPRPAWNTGAASSGSACPDSRDADSSSRPVLGALLSGSERLATNCWVSCGLGANRAGVYTSGSASGSLLG